MGNIFRERWNRNIYIYIYLLYILLNERKVLQMHTGCLTTPTPISQVLMRWFFCLCFFLGLLVTIILAFVLSDNQNLKVNCKLILIRIKNWITFLWFTRVQGFSFCLPCISASLQLECDKEITAHVGGEFILKCKYGINHFLYSKKYWCRGPSRSNCEIVADSENSRNTHRSQVIDLNRRGLFVKVTNLRFDDAGAYWVGIDKIYADIMTQVKVIITEGKNKRRYAT